MFVCINMQFNLHFGVGPEFIQQTLNTDKHSAIVQRCLQLEAVISLCIEAHTSLVFIHKDTLLFCSHMWQCCFLALKG